MEKHATHATIFRFPLGKLFRGKTMGGIGSGRKRFRSLTTEKLQLDVRSLQRRGYLEPGNYFTLTWTCDGQEIGGVKFRTYSLQPLGLH